jgi:hypothetical protein
MAPIAGLCLERFLGDARAHAQLTKHRAKPG